MFTWTNLLVVVSELCGSEQDALDLVPLITNVVLEEHHLIVGVVVIVDPGVIPINSRGEKQRMHLRDSFLADQLDPIYVAYNMWGIVAVRLHSVHAPVYSNDNGFTHAATQSSITSISWSLHACGRPCHELCTVFYTWGLWPGIKSCTRFAVREQNHFWNELHEPPESWKLSTYTDSKFSNSNSHFQTCNITDACAHYCLLRQRAEENYSHSSCTDMSIVIISRTYCPVKNEAKYIFATFLPLRISCLIKV